MTQNDTELHQLSARQLSEKITAKQISALDLTNYFLGRIEALEPQINACNFVCADTARAAAKAFDANQDANLNTTDAQGGLLAGLPLAHKDIFVSTDSPTTAGSRILEGYQSPFDATVVTRLSQAGMINLAKLNMDEFAMGSSNESSYFGATKNPWDLSCVPGGSSGGSAAAVAAGMVPFATATDTGGSIRQPASFCGVTGIKPTYGAVSRYGMIAYASSLDQAGVIARRAEDCALVLESMIAQDPLDSTSHAHPAPNLLGAIDALSEDQPLKGVKIGVPRSYMDERLDPCVLRVTKEAIATYESLGATIVDAQLPSTDHAIAAYYLIAASEASSNLSRFDGVRYGHRASDPADLDDLYETTRAEGFGAEVKRRILIGTYALSAGYFDAYYVKAQKVRRLIRDAYRKAFEGCDMILTPVAPTPAYKLGDKQDSVSMYLGDAFTIGVNLAGLPALSHPAGFSVEGLPIGAQLIGPAWHEAQILAAAHAYQQVSDHHLQEPSMSKMPMQPASAEHLA